jgi:hypothetical protein
MEKPTDKPTRQRYSKKVLDVKIAALLLKMRDQKVTKKKSGIKIDIDDIDAIIRYCNCDICRVANALASDHIGFKKMLANAIGLGLAYDVHIIKD